MKYCPRCNARFDDSNIFCLNDGSNLFTEDDEQETHFSANRQKTGNVQSSQPNYLKYIIPGIAGFLALAGIMAFVLWKSNQPASVPVIAEAQNSNDNLKLKEKELELKEKELALKQKELESKTPETVQKSPSAVAPVEKPLPPSRANSSSSYSGSIGSSGSIFNLSWNKNKTVTGSFYYNGTQNSVYTISGSNVPEGQASVNVFDGDQTIGTMKLFKNISSNKVCWTGSFYQSNGSTLPVSFCRYR